MDNLEKGQRILANDLKALLAEVEAGEFGDFSNEKYPAPKIELASQLLVLRNNVIDGKYDSISHD